MNISALSLDAQFRTIKAYELPDAFQIPTFVTDFADDVPAWYEIKGVGDFNADGLDDLVIHTVDSYSPVTFLISDGDGTFSPFEMDEGSVERHHIRYGEVADINLDGIDDFAGFEASHLMSDQRDIAIYGSSSEEYQTFEPHSNGEIGNHGGSVGDLNSDGLPDIFGVREFSINSVPDAEDRRPALQTPEGNFSFGAHSLPIELEKYRIPDAVIVDLDNDGENEIILGLQSDEDSRDGGEVTFSTLKETPVGAIIWGEEGVLLQDREIDYFGDHWMSSSDFKDYEKAYGETVDDAVFGALKVAALNIDGVPGLEVIVNSTWQNGFKQRGGGIEVFNAKRSEVVDITEKLFPNLKTQEAPGSMNPQGFQTADLNGDGILDFIIRAADYAVADGEGIGQENGEFLPIETGAGLNMSLNQASAGDFDGDGSDDLVIEGDGNLYALLNRFEEASVRKVFGSSVDDTLEIRGPALVTGLGGDDEIRNVGESEVAVKYSGPFNGFGLERDGRALTVEDEVGSQGVDTLEGVQRLIFDDVYISVSSDGNAGNLYRLYEASFDRAPDPTGLGYWIAQLEGGLSTVDAAARFIDSAEFRGLYGEQLANDVFVETLYRNILDRDPDSAGLDWWVNELGSGGMSRPEVLARFSDSAENRENVEPLIASGIAYDPWDSGIA
jgi:hypothetical protein